MTHSPSPPAFELRNVRKQFAGREVLRGVDLSVAAGEVFALVGASGSGKSTVLKLVSGIERPDVGEVWLAGSPVTHLPPHRRPVHTVFQNYALFPHLDVAGNVAFPLRVAGRSRDEIGERVTRALGWVRLDSFARRRVETLSGGERQRVALARALVDEPRCVLLDEPLSALDPHLRAATLELLQEIQARLQVTYLYVTHDREEALRAAHRIGVLHEGRLAQVGPPEEIYHRPRTPYVASFVGRINWFRGRREAGGLRLAGGAFVPCERFPAEEGGEWLLGVRPEDLALAATGFLAARVVQRQFSGASVALRLAVGEGPTLAAEMPGGQEAPQPGDEVHVAWAPQAMRLFPAHGAERLP